MRLALDRAAAEQGEDDLQRPGDAAQPVQERVRADRRAAQAALRPDPQPGRDAKAYMAHERETLEAVIQARNQAAAPTGRGGNPGDAGGDAAG
jgi:hypothetical protein